MAKKITLPVYNAKGEIIKSLELKADAVVNNNLLAQATRVYLVNQRQGTVSSKTRSQVVGSTRKIYRQKGTGRARHGDIKAPVFVGGGTAHGPKPKDYSLKLNKKQRAQAFLAAFNLRANEKNILVLDSQAIKIEPKTKAFLALLKQLKVEKEKILVVLEKMAKNNFTQAAANLKNVDLASAQSLSFYQLLSHSKIIFIEPALTVLKIIQ